MSKKKREIKAFEQAKAELVNAVKESIASVEGAIMSTKEALENNVKHNYHKFHNLFNLSLYSDITHLDLVILSSKQQLANEKVEKVLFTRLIAMTIFEYLNDIGGLLGGKLSKEIERNGFFSFIPELRRLNADFSRLKKENHLTLKEIRNKSAAHKSKEALNLLNFINEDLDPHLIFTLSIKVLGLLRELSDYTTRIIKHIIINNVMKKDFDKI